MTTQWPSLGTMAAPHSNIPTSSFGDAAAGGQGDVRFPATAGEPPAHDVHGSAGRGTEEDPLGLHGLLVRRAACCCQSLL